MLGREINRAYHRRFGTRPYNTDGTDFMAEDWDNLLILDACRADLFEEYNTIDGTLETRVSRGSNTVEFLKGNVANRQLWDTVYVTANPQINNHFDLLNPDFHDVIDVWQSHWNDEYNTVLPEDLTEEAIKASKKYPNKRLVIHYIQPHMPFIDSPVSFGDEMFDTSEGPWNWVMKGETDVEEADLREANETNLEVALPHVERAVDQLTGKTVVTSDHGQCINDRSYPIPIKEWGHPWGQYIDPLVKVPWLICKGDPRKDITADPPQANESEGVGDNLVEERLEHLGYR